MRMVDKERTDKLFRDDPIELRTPAELNQPTEIRRNHYPPGPVKDEPGKQKIYTTMKGVVQEAAQVLNEKAE